MSNNTRGTASIVDRKHGWGHTAGSETFRNDGNVTTMTVTNEDSEDSDEAREDTATRVARRLRLRKSFSEVGQSQLRDRTKGYGGNFNPAGGADEYLDSMTDESPVSLIDDEDEAFGIFRDASNSARSGTGANTASTDSDTDALADGRTADSRDTVLLNDGNATRRAEATRASIIDRGFNLAEGGLEDDGDDFAGWGHTVGSLVYRSDAVD